MEINYFPESKRPYSGGKEENVYGEEIVCIFVTSHLNNDAMRFLADRNSCVCEKLTKYTSAVMVAYTIRDKEII